MIKKLGLAIVYVLVGLAIYFYGEDILTWLQTEATNYVVMTTIAATALALFPVIPYPIVGGVIGAAFGPAWGAFITWSGSASASLIMFIIVRYTYQDWGRAILSRYRPLDRVTRLFENNAFITILITRLLPVIPSIIINVYAALSRVGFVSYALASMLGKAPSMLLFAVVGNTLMTNPTDIFITISVYMIFLTIVFTCYRLWQKRTV